MWRGSAEGTERERRMEVLVREDKERRKKEKED